MRYGRLLFLSLIVIVGLAMAACREDPGAAGVSADCNPRPVSQPSLPDIVESIEYQDGAVYGPLHSMFAEGEWVYLGVGESFVVVDGSVAAAPEVVGKLSLRAYENQSYRNFSVREGLAYFSWNDRDYTIDVSDPTAPELVDCSSPVPWPEAEVAFWGRYFINNSIFGGVTIEERPPRGGPVEVAGFTTTTLPELRWEQPPGQPVPQPVFTAGEPMYVRSYTFDDRYLYLLNVLRIPGDYCCGRLTILDMKEPGNPAHVSTTALPRELAPLSIKVVDDWLFINYYEPLGYNPEIRMYDISSRRRPQEVGGVPGIVLPVVYEGHAYFPGDEDIVIWQLEGREPELIGKIEIAEGGSGSVSSSGVRIEFVGDFIYTGYRDGLVVFNNEDRANPAFESLLSFSQRPVLGRLAVGDGRLVGLSRNREVVQVGLAEDAFAGQWRPLSMPPASYELIDIALDGGYSAVLGLESRPTEVYTTHLTLLDKSGAVIDSGVMGQVEGRGVGLAYPYLYLLNGTVYDSTLLVFNYSASDGPELVAEIEMEADFYKDMALWNDSLFLVTTAREGGVWHFDVSERERPQFVEKLPFDLMHTITLGDGYLFGLNLTNQIEVVRLGPDGGGVLIGRFDIERGDVLDIAYGDGVLYLALAERGVAAVRLNLD